MQPYTQYSIICETAFVAATGFVKILVSTTDEVLNSNEYRADNGPGGAAT